jgi:hypothetical protein
MRMSGFSRSTRRRSTVLGAALAAVTALAGGFALAGCGGGTVAALPANSPIGIETSQFGVTVDNKSGVPLVDLAVIVQTPSMDFTSSIPRLEDAEHHEIRIDDFTSRDGTHLNLRVEQPRSVRVTASDITHKPYDVATSWQ